MSNGQGTVPHGTDEAQVAAAAVLLRRARQKKMDDNQRQFGASWDPADS
jgi:hypothetical protein